MAKYLKILRVIAIGIYISKCHKNYSENIIKTTEKLQGVQEIRNVEK